VKTAVKIFDCTDFAGFAGVKGFCVEGVDPGVDATDCWRIEA
jgi:hypothetical protein